MGELLHLTEDGASCFTEAFTSPQALLRTVPALGPLIIGTDISIVQNKNPVKSFAIHLHLTEDGDFLRGWIKVLRCSPEIAERLSKRLLRKGLVVGFLKEGDAVSPWINRADVVFIVKDGKARSR